MQQTLNAEKTAISEFPEEFSSLYKQQFVDLLQRCFVYRKNLKTKELKGLDAYDAENTRDDILRLDNLSCNYSGEAFEGRPGFCAEKDNIHDFLNNLAETIRVAKKSFKLSQNDAEKAVFHFAQLPKNADKLIRVAETNDIEAFTDDVWIHLTELQASSVKDLSREGIAQKKAWHPTGWRQQAINKTPEA